MWIRSQNESVLVNVNDICFYKMNKNIYQIRCYEYGNYYILGEYSTEEKALKVMDMIHNQIIQWLKSEFVFQMPKDEEVE